MSFQTETASFNVTRAASSNLPNNNNSIREFGYNLKTTPIVFVGGGAVVMKNFGSHDAKNISYNLDVKANARGYEQLATMGLKSTKRLS